MTNKILGVYVDPFIDIPQTNLKNIIKDKYPNLRGRDWIRSIAPEDREVFIKIGMEYNQHGKLGGLARVSKCTRDSHGRFTKAPQPE